MYTIILLLAALIPPFVLLGGVYKLDQIEKEPVALIRSLFFWGVVSAVPAIILEGAAETAFSSLISDETLLLLIENFVGVALVEEGCKHFILKRKTWNHPEFNYVFDAVVYSVTVSLGFAAIENVLYVTFAGLGTALVRALLSIPGHCIFGIYMGYYYGMAKVGHVHGQAERTRSCMLKSMVIPVLLHGLYDYLLTLENEFAILIFIALVIILDISAWRGIKRFSKEDRQITGADMNNQDIF